MLHVMYAKRVESRTALPRMNQQFRPRGYRFVTVSELLAAP